MTVNDYAIPRMPDDEARPVTSKQEADRVWHPRFLADIVAGRDPRIPPKPVNRVARAQTIADFLDRYVKECVVPKKLASLASVQAESRC